MITQNNISFIRATVEATREHLNAKPVVGQFKLIEIRTYVENCETLLAEIDQLNKKLEEMVKSCLELNNYDGLINGDCGCSLDDFICCGQIEGDCCAAYKHADGLMYLEKPEMKPIGLGNIELLASWLCGPVQCPSKIGLTDLPDCDYHWLTADCQACWESALITIGIVKEESEVEK